MGEKRFLQSLKTQAVSATNRIEGAMGEPSSPRIRRKPEDLGRVPSERKMKHVAGRREVSRDDLQDLVRSSGPGHGGGSVQHRACPPGAGGWTVLVTDTLLIATSWMFAAVPAKPGGSWWDQVGRLSLARSAPSSALGVRPPPGHREKQRESTTHWTERQPVCFPGRTRARQLPRSCHFLSRWEEQPPILPL